MVVRNRGAHARLALLFVANNWYMTCCPRKASSHLHGHCLVSSAQERRPTWIFDPAPLTPSDEEIRKAQAIREALRRQLLNRSEPQFIPSWVVGAD